MPCASPVPFLFLPSLLTIRYSENESDTRNAGLHETGHIERFSYGVADRCAPVFPSSLLSSSR